MEKVEIKNFGPIKAATIDLEKDIQIFIGVQAAGKSTICKVVYFCRKIRDYTLDFLMEERQFTENHKHEYFNNYLKYLTRQFMGCFGTTRHMSEFFISYQRNQASFTIRLNSDGFVRFRFDQILRDFLDNLIEEVAELYVSKIEHYSSIAERLDVLTMMKQQFHNKLCSMFGSEETLYIPAGRSLLATMSEQLQGYPVSDMDLTMQEFISCIQNIKRKFGTRIPEVIKNYTKTVKGQIDNAAVDFAYKLILDIIKADYASESDGEKIYFDESHWVKLMYSSSGQQESLWIALLAFDTILERKKRLILVEEPEAHLFPEAQKKIVELISLMVNSSGSRAIVTTHSPYTLTSFNVLLYSGKVEGRQRSNGKSVIPRSLRVSYNSFAAYQVGGKVPGMILPLMDAESQMIDTEYIDTVSSITNEELERLLDMEAEDDL